MKKYKPELNRGPFMPMKCPRSLFLSMVLLVSSVSFLSCKAFTSQGTAEHLKQRATEYWDLKIKGQFEKAFAYESPDLVKDVSLMTYLTSIGRGVDWLAAEPESVSIEGDKGTVNMKIRYRWTFTQDQPQDGLIGLYAEQWKLYEGKWYHIYKGRHDTQGQQAAPGTDKKTENQNSPLAPKAGPPQPAGPKAGTPEETGQKKTLESPVKPTDPSESVTQAGSGAQETDSSAKTEKYQKQGGEPKNP
jgi:hypothetical protein